ncbi:flavin reductase family protein [Cryptosporangium japonicum]|uniref:Flavin reductase family protein n=1 Tax=Cryptosporangium japonicum TaxID=80872 RepID=A0ABN0UF85_9ACTN
MTLVDDARFRQVLGRYPTGVSVITSREPDGTPVSMVVGTFTAVSLQPPLVGFLPDHGSTSWPRIRATGRFAVSVLAADQQDVCRMIVAKHPGRFDLLEWADSPSGCPLLVGAAAWVDCVIESVQAAGDHDVVLGRVLDLDAGPTSSGPLVFLGGAYAEATPTL